MANGLTWVTWLVLLVPMPLCVLGAIGTWFLER